MPPVDRNNPVRAKSSQSRISFMEFQREFPDDATCLEWLWRNRFSQDGEHAHCPKCDQERSFKRYETKQRRQSWTCTGCGHHIHPTAGTIVRTRTAVRGLSVRSAAWLSQVGADRFIGGLRTKHLAPGRG